MFLADADQGTIAGAIITGAGIIAAALRWVVQVITKAINNHAEGIKEHAVALDKNSNALIANTAKIVLVLFCCLVAFTGCASTDPLIVQALERNQEVWEEDRRQDIPELKVKARLREFKAQQRYAKAGDK